MAVWDLTGRAAAAGADYLAFWVGGCRCIVLNSSLHSAQEEQLWDTSRPDFALGPHESAATVLQDKEESQALAEEQDRWLEEELGSGASDAAVHTIVFTHIPPFILSADEPKGYFNYDPEVRMPLLEKLRAAGCGYWFCGHYHRNAGGTYTDADGRTLEVVTTSAVGTHLIEDPDGDPLGLTGFSFPTALGEETSGFRLVTVERERLTHKWFSLAEAPDVVEPVAAAAAWRRGEEPNTTARL